MTRSGPRVVQLWTAFVQEANEPLHSGGVFTSPSEAMNACQLHYDRNHERFPSYTAERIEWGGESGVSGYASQHLGWVYYVVRSSKVSAP